MNELPRGLRPPCPKCRKLIFHNMMMRHPFFLRYFKFLLLALPTVIIAQTTVHTEVHALTSEDPAEARDIWVNLPPGYHDTIGTPPRYPVIYLLDAERTHAMAMGVIPWMINNQQIPESIVVSIPNVDRFRDMTPTHSLLDADGTTPPAFASSGGAAGFDRFLQHTVDSFLHANYRTNGYTVIVGHSLGGLYVTQSYLDNQFYDGYLALDPSYWWDGEYTIDRLRGHPDTDDLCDSRLYLCGASHSSTRDTSAMRRSLGHFVEALRQEISCPQQVLPAQFDDEHHGSVPMVGLYYGLRFIFEGFELPVNALLNLDVADIERHFTEYSERMGSRFLLPEAQILLYANHFLRVEQKVDRGLAFYEWSTRAYPDSARSHKQLGLAYAELGRMEDALRSMRVVRRLDPQDATANQFLKDND